MGVFRDLRTDQVFSRPYIQEDNTYIEAWFVTAECEGIHREEHDDLV